MDKEIVIDGRAYTLVSDQRTGSGVYRSDGVYARLGSPERIARDVANHREMDAVGMPLAKILSEGSYGPYAYYMEESLGDLTFRSVFEQDIAAGGEISAAHFAEFLSIVERYLQAQLKAVRPADRDALARGVHLKSLVEELPQYAYSLPDKFDRLLRKLEPFPFVLSHGDFNPANILQRGVIDVEDVFTAPFGFDAVSAVSTIQWFPTERTYEYFARYTFTPAQRVEYLAMCDRISNTAGYPAISEYYDDFAFFRSMWSTARMHEWPKIQAWRYDKFIKTYLFN